MQWRYYFKKDDSIVSDNATPNAQPFAGKLTLASLSYGIRPDEIEKIRNHFVELGFLIRVAVFEDGSECQNQKYNLAQGAIPALDSYMIGMLPTEAAQIITSSIIDGFDILPIMGGLGFCEHIPYVIEELIKNKEELVGKPKIRLFGFSNSSISVMLSDVLQFVHTPSSISFRMQNFALVEEVIKGKRTEFSRMAFPLNDAAKALTARDLAQFTCIPINISTFFPYFSNSMWVFNPGQQPYSLMLETIAWKAAKPVIEELRIFLQDLKSRDQLLPMMIEIGDITPSAFPMVVYKNGLMMTIKELRELYKPEFANLRKYDLKRKIISYRDKKNVKSQDNEQLDQILSDHDADEYIKEVLHPIYHQYVEEIKNVADDFRIALFEGGEKRIGHGFFNIVQPSNSLNKVVLKDEGVIAISCEINERAVITPQDLRNLEAIRRKPLPTVHTADKFREVEDVIELKLIPLNCANPEIEKCHDVIISKNWNRLAETDSKKIKCFIFNNN